MDESSRRALLGGLGAGVAGLLAGCAGRAPVVGTEQVTSTPPPSTPDGSPDRPAFWKWLPDPAAVGGGYSFGSLTVPDAQSAELARNRLAPARFTPPQVHDLFASTTELLTVSTGSVAGGLLQGDYDPEAITAALESAGFAAEGDGIYVGDRLGFAPESTLLRWADDPSGPAGLLGVLGQRFADAGASFVTSDSPVERVLSAIRGTPARFARPLAVDGEAFGSAQFLANGIGPSDGAIQWHSAIAFEGDVPDAAADEYRQSFVDRNGFENVRERTEPGLLVIEAETTAQRATATQPL